MVGPQPVKTRDCGGDKSRAELKQVHPPQLRCGNKLPWIVTPHSPHNHNNPTTQDTDQGQRHNTGQASNNKENDSSGSVYQPVPTIITNPNNSSIHQDIFYLLSPCAPLIHHCSTRPRRSSPLEIRSTTNNALLTGSILINQSYYNIYS